MRGTTTAVVFSRRSLSTSGARCQAARTTDGCVRTKRTFVRWMAFASSHTTVGVRQACAICSSCASCLLLPLVVGLTQQESGVNAERSWRVGCVRAHGHGLASLQRAKAPGTFPLDFLPFLNLTAFQHVTLRPILARVCLERYVQSPPRARYSNTCHNQDFGLFRLQSGILTGRKQI